MNAEQIRNGWDDDEHPTSAFPTRPFTQPRADRDAELVAYDQLSRESEALRQLAVELGHLAVESIRAFCDLVESGRGGQP